MHYLDIKMLINEKRESFVETLRITDKILFNFWEDLSFVYSCIPQTCNLNNYPQNIEFVFLGL